jgi:hypothetical protein
MAMPKSGTIGQSATDRPAEVLPILKRAWEAPFTTRSDFARRHIEQVAIAACLGLLTVHGTTGWGRVWRITSSGLQHLETT